MLVGCVKEIKDDEQRVALTPSHVVEYIKGGNDVIVESGLGLGSQYDDEDYKLAGATVYKTAKEVWEKAEMIVKVKEPIESEYDLMQENQILFTFVHLASNKPLTDALLKNKVSAVAYETVRNRNGNLALLKPMSQVAGRLSIQQGAKYLEKSFGGKGLLLSGVPGVRRGHVTIIGGGVVGMSACMTALGTGATVSVLDRDLDRLDYIEDVFNGEVETLYSDEKNLMDEVKKADIIVGSVLLPGAETPKIVRREHLQYMEKGTVLVDVAIDQGGCFETSRPTTHHEPIFIDEGIVHYCVTNMPGAVPKTATRALANATLPYGMRIARFGLDKAFEMDQGLMEGLNTHQGYVTNKAVANALGLEYKEYKI